jgi:predicted Holliday junction resolvase-like endonuclease
MSNLGQGTILVLSRFKMMTMHDASPFIIVAILFLALGFYLGEKITKKKAAEFHVRSTKAQRSILGGKFSEHIATLLPHFPHGLKGSEARFIGDPIDFLFFKGKDEHRIDEIVFLEVKTGEAPLSDIELQLKAAVDAGRVRWDLYRVPKDVTNGISNPNA